MIFGRTKIVVDLRLGDPHDVVSVEVGRKVTTFPKVEEQETAKLSDMMRQRFGIVTTISVNSFEVVNFV